MIGGQVSRAVTNPTFDPVSPAGAMADYFRGNPSGKTPLEYLGRPEPINPAYRDRDARLATMDEHGLEKMWLFPTLGMIYEEPLKHDPEAVTLLFTAFNRWLEEDWGFAYQDRIFAGPYISLADVDWAVEGARVGARPRRPHHRACARPRSTPPTACSPRPTRSSTPSGPG